ncbi:protein tilB isoform X2 [Wyeomyia smithii]|uniref:protein tilB isoform X2 n=1 Tax=Wyeomyia smithii TaxID=174621 RepID=UPI002467F5C6|nr:protein tilB isoform X2 [Wyeomyia smithii]
MVRITEQLVRKRSEHNELVIGTLEELSLHQEDIERIEHIGRWCRELKILLLQSNLISKIENLHMLKRLEYLNLALNNIERIENLDGLESLQKLDLTLNFIGQLTSVESLRNNYNLKELFLTGNPCTDYPNYRNYVICALPQLQTLDGQDITRTERLKAGDFQKTRSLILLSETAYQIERDEQKIRVAQSIIDQESSVEHLDEEQRTTQFWQQKSEHCPETRNFMAKYSRRAKETPVSSLESLANKARKRILFAECGRPYSVNEPKLTFMFHDEDHQYQIDLHVFKYLDTSYIEVDVQPNYIRVTIKGKIFQLALKEEVQTDKSSCQRSATTGHLLIVLPKLNAQNVSFQQSTRAREDVQPGNIATELKGTVDYRHIVSKSQETCNAQCDEGEIPPLI